MRRPINAGISVAAVPAVTPGQRRLPSQPHVGTTAIALVLLFLGPACGGSPSAPSESQPPPPVTQRTTVRGSVRDAGNQNLLAHVRVELTAGTETSVAETMFEGTFLLVAPRGAATITVTAAGYGSQSRNLELSDDMSVDFALERAAGRTTPCGDAPDAGNRVFTLFSRPFRGIYPLTNYFDHDRPLQFDDSNGYQLNACEERISAAGRVDGHNGYDWLLPTGTAVMAVADGAVTSAGLDPPFACPPLGRTVSDQMFVEIRHPSVNGEEFSSVYVHLSRLDVTAGQTVARGQTIGLSGNTGCSTTPHLHFGVWRFTHTNSGRPTRVDPFGWEGRGRDPWAEDPAGSASIWLWQPGEAPALH